MSVDRFLKPYTSNDSDDKENVKDQGCFGLLRGQRDRALMVELRRRDGSILAVPYTMIEQIRFDRTDGITVYAVGKEIKIVGRLLNAEGPSSLFSALARHRCPWVSELDRTTIMSSDAQPPVVESIAW